MNLGAAPGPESEKPGLDLWGTRVMLHLCTTVTLSVLIPRRVNRSVGVKLCVCVCAGRVVFYYKPTPGTVFVRADVRQGREEGSAAVNAARC